MLLRPRTRPARGSLPRQVRTPVQILASLLLVAAAGVVLARGVTLPAAAASAVDGQPPSTAAQEAGMTPGLPFADPPDADTVAAPRLTIRLDAAGTRFDLSGRRVWGQSYNGSFVAPTLHLAPGRDTAVTLVNHLPVATNLHFHGLHVSPTDHSDDSFVCVAPGSTFRYHLVLPADHPIGTFWYHSHAMGTACPAPGGGGSAGAGSMAGMAGAAGTPPPPGPAFTPGDVENQIFAGLSGALVVGDDRTLLPPALRHITAHTVVLKDVQTDASGRIVQNTDTTSIDSNKATARLVNGLLRPVLTMRPGQTQLWRLVNAGADIFYQLRLGGHHFTVIGEDGQPVAKVTARDTLLLPPGKRYDVLVTAPRKPGGTWLRTTAYSNGPQGDAYPDVALARIDVAGTPLHRLPSLSGGLPTAPPDLAQAPVAAHRFLALSEDGTGSNFYLDGRQFSMDTSVFDTPAELGTVEEWTLVNLSGEDHPFHIHTDGFQVMSVNGVPQPYTHRQDTVPVPHATGGVPGRVVLRIAFADFTGRVMFHCHIAAHEDNGMMSFVDVVS